MPTRQTLACLLLFIVAASAAGEEAKFRTCYARWSPDELVIGNAHIERSWRIRDGLLTATSFRDLDAGCQWIAKPANSPAPCPNGILPDDHRSVTITAKSGRFSAVEEESLVVEMVADGKQRLSYRFQIFDAARGVGIRFDGEGTAQATAAGNGKAAGDGKAVEATGIEAAPQTAAAKESGDALEDLFLAPQHVQFTQVTLYDQTDIRNELVFENNWLLQPNEAPLKLKGNVFYLENKLDGTGLVFLKLAPLPYARPVKSEADAMVRPGARRVRFAGQGYPFVLLAYKGGRFGRIEALQTYQRQLRVYDPQRDGKFFSNTWGDRNRDARINEEFMLKEIAAGARIGVDVVQVDDGWQKGLSANSAKGKGVWNGYWAADPDFWRPDAKRFPGGLAPVVKAASKQGLKFGIWYAPDSSGDFANWQRDADRLLELHKTEGIDYFKLDSIKMHSTAGEANLRRMFDRVLRESQGRVVLELDVTAEIRPSYFGLPEQGPIFVENRYTDFHNYWPHQTLRNLWQLSHYVDPLRMRMELLNNTRNAALYKDDPLAPARYRPDALFAMTMVANPLGFFETSNLPEAFVAETAKLVAVWKRQRAAMFSGRTYPIGDAPDGASWTGFATVGVGGKSGYLLLFRELNQQAEWSADLPLFGGKVSKVTRLAGNGSAQFTGQRLTANIPQELDYLWVRVETD